MINDVDSEKLWWNQEVTSRLTDHGVELLTLISATTKHRMHAQRP